MTKTISNLLVVTSGGDAPGMNAAIRAVVRTACYHGITVHGCRGGYQGLIDQDIIPLAPESVANCIQRGGTILKTGRCEAFKDSGVRAKCIAFLKAKQIDAMVVIGGDGSGPESPFFAMRSLDSNDVISLESWGGDLFFYRLYPLGGDRVELWATQRDTWLAEQTDQALLTIIVRVGERRMVLRGKLYSVKAKNKDDA